MTPISHPSVPQAASAPAALSQDELKTLVGQAALKYVVPGEIVGVGTGSTVNKFIDALATMKDQIAGAVSSSVASTERLLALGIRVFDCNEVARLAVYIDGADEIDGKGNMVKGGGAALTREKIVAAQSDRFVCIADESKLVEVLGMFPLPVEVIPMATQRLIAQFAARGGTARVRLRNGVPLVTDNGQHLLDVTGLRIIDPQAFESEVSQWPGVVTVGVFAHQRAQVCLLGTADGVKTMTF
jgi:ribose 5-phosphate isomerase A